MDILKIIKNRYTIRKYKKKAIPSRLINKIVESGLWASSIHNFQPWRFIIITDKKTIKQIATIFNNKTSEVKGGIDNLLDLSANTIRHAPLLVVVYNSKEFSDIAGRFFKIDNMYIEVAKITEIQGISAAIQNMILSGQSLGIGSCWITTALFCEKEINNFLDAEGKLIAIVTFGYPSEKGKRSFRKKKSVLVRNVG